MSDPTTRQKALAAQVILPLAPLPTEPGPCPAWIESRGARCSKPATDGLLCSRHHAVAVARLEKRLAARTAAEHEAAETRARRLPTWRAELANLEAQIARLEARIRPLDTTDRAAYGGRINARVDARRDAANLRFLEAGRRIHQAQVRANDLRRLIGDDA